MADTAHNYGDKNRNIMLPFNDFNRLIKWWKRILTRHLHQQLLHGNLRCKETNDQVVKWDDIKVISKQKLHSSGMGWPFLSSVLQIGMVWLVSQPIYKDTN